MKTSFIADEVSLIDKHKPPTKGLQRKCHLYLWCGSAGSREAVSREEERQVAQVGLERIRDTPSLLAKLLSPPECSSIAREIAVRSSAILTRAAMEWKPARLLCTESFLRRELYSHERSSGVAVSALSRVFSVVAAILPSHHNAGHPAAA
jgi:hypothetical protein